MKELKVGERVTITLEAMNIELVKDASLMERMTTAVQLHFD